MLSYAAAQKADFAFLHGCDFVMTLDLVSRLDLRPAKAADFGWLLKFFALNRGLTKINFRFIRLILTFADAKK